MQNDSAIIPTDPYEWLENTIHKIRLISNEKITIREHPHKLKKFQKFSRLLKKINIKIVV